MINLEYDIQQISKLKDKFDKYPPFALGQGLEASASFLNSPMVKTSIYPPSQSGQPFIWSSEKQRRYVFANIQLPSVRTYNLANSGEFKVEKRYSSLYIYYETLVDYAKWVIGSFTQIIGHRFRGWKPVNTIVTERYRNDVLQSFKQAAINAWTEMDNFIMGGGAGL